MKDVLLDFKPVLDNPNLVSESIIKAINKLSQEEQRKVLVAEIDPEYADGTKLCNKYNVDPKTAIKCLVAKGLRGDDEKIIILLVPVGYKYNMSSIVRKTINAKTVSVAPLDFVLEKSGMEYGSITPIGLPDSWLLFLDPLVLDQKHIIIGGGLKKSKISIPSKLLLSLPNAVILEGLGKKESN